MFSLNRNSFKLLYNSKSLQEERETSPSIRLSLEKTTKRDRIARRVRCNRVNRCKSDRVEKLEVNRSITVDSEWSKVHFPPNSVSRFRQVIDRLSSRSQETVKRATTLVATISRVNTSISTLFPSNNFLLVFLPTHRNLVTLTLEPVRFTVSAMFRLSHKHRKLMVSVRNL